MNLFETVRNVGARASRLFGGAASASELAEKQKPVRRGDELEELGAAGTQSFSGYIREDYNPEFTGRNAIRLYDKMRKTDGTVSAVLSALKVPIVSAQWAIEPVDSRDEDSVKIAEFVRENLEGVDCGEHGMTSFIRQALGHLDFGYYYFEKVYKIEDGMIKLRKLAPRMPSAHMSWVQESKPGEPGVTQLLPSTDGLTNSNPKREIPMSKIVLFTNQREGDNYEGVSVLRPCYKHWYLKDTLYRIDGIKHERGAGILVITRPSNSNDDDKAAADEIGENFKLNEQAFINAPNSDWKFELLTEGISDQTSGLNASVLHHDRMIAKSILAQFLDLGGGESGSFALSKDQTSFFEMVLKSISAYVAEVVTHSVVKDLIDLNFGPQKKYPKFKFTAIGEMDKAVMADVLGKLITAGVVEMTPQLKVWVAKAFELPELRIEDVEEGEDDAEGLPKTQEGPKDAPAGDGGGKPPTGRKEASLAERRYFRPFTYAEKRVKFAEVEDYFDDAEGKLEGELGKLTEEQKADLLKKAERIIDADDIGAVSDLSLPQEGAVAEAVKEQAKAALEKGKASAALEVGAKIPVTTSYTKKVLAAKIALYLRRRRERITEAVKERLIDLMNNEVGKAQALFDLERIIDKRSNEANSSLVGKVVIDSFDEGRFLTFDDIKDRLYALQRSEILDDATCQMCMSLDGKTLSPNDPFTQIGQIHDHCRGMWVGVLKTDAELPEVKTLPKSILNRFERADGVPSTNGFEQLDRPIVSRGSRLERKIKDGEIEV